jgi:hypothetical protein
MKLGSILLISLGSCVFLAQARCTSLGSGEGSGTGTGTETLEAAAAAGTYRKGRGHTENHGSHAEIVNMGM